MPRPTAQRICSAFFLDESLETKDPEDTQLEEFNQMVRFNGDRYEVTLPWNDSGQVLGCALVKKVITCLKFEGRPCLSPSPPTTAGVQAQRNAPLPILVWILWDLCIKGPQGAASNKVWICMPLHLLHSTCSTP